MREVLNEVERWLAAGTGVALARVVSVKGSAPRATGAALAIAADGGISGSVSGGCVEPAVIEEGMRAIRTGRPVLLRYGITEEQNVEQIGLSCGGEIRVFVERVEPNGPLAALLPALHHELPATLLTVIGPETSPAFGASRLLIEAPDAPPNGTLGASTLDAAADAAAQEQLARSESAALMFPGEAGEVEVFVDAHPAPKTLVIVGAGHVSIPLARIAKVLGYHVVVLDAREAFATRERFPEVDDLRVAWPDEALATLPLTPSTAIAVLTHDEKFDVPALAAAVAAPVGYIGAIGSRGTREGRNERLRAAGVTDEQLARIHGPIGLDLGARSPEEIALSILAQIVAVRHGKQG